MVLHRSLCFPSLFLTLLLVALTVPVFASDLTKIQQSALTCQVKGGSFVLNDEDFAAISRKELDNGKFTPEYVASLDKNSKVWRQICDTRGLWRAVKAKTATCDDFVTNFPDWMVSYWSKEENQAVLLCQIDTMDCTPNTHCR